MSVQYVQTLIPKDREFIPQPRQVSKFFNDLETQQSAPRQASYGLGTVAGIRKGTHPLTGETLSALKWSFVFLPSRDNLDGKLRDLDSYNATLAGQGPPDVPPFELYTVDKNGQYIEKFVEQYEFRVECCLRSEIVSMSDWHEEISPLRETVSPFSMPCLPKNQAGFFHHPRTGNLIEVPGAACARFWIEFQCGKQVLPRIENDLNVLDHSIVQAAEKVFEVGFVQGCYWG